jgi:hypothetical protein
MVNGESVAATLSRRVPFNRSINFIALKMPVGADWKALS